MGDDLSVRAAEEPELIVSCLKGQWGHCGGILSVNRRSHCKEGVLKVLCVRHPALLRMALARARLFSWNKNTWRWRWKVLPYLLVDTCNQSEGIAKCPNTQWCIELLCCVQQCEGPRSTVYQGFFAADKFSIKLIKQPIPILRNDQQWAATSPGTGAAPGDGYLSLGNW